MRFSDSGAVLAPLREDERLLCAVKCVVGRGVVFPRSRRRSLDAEPKHNKLVSSNVFLVEAAAHVSCCCCCGSGRILGPIEDPGVDATEVQRELITVLSYIDDAHLDSRSSCVGDSCYGRGGWEDVVLRTI